MFLDFSDSVFHFFVCRVGGSVLCLLPVGCGLLLRMSTGQGHSPTSFPIAIASVFIVHLAFCNLRQKTFVGLSDQNSVKIP